MKKKLILFITICFTLFVSISFKANAMYDMYDDVDSKSGIFELEEGSRQFNHIDCPSMEEMKKTNWFKILDGKFNELIDCAYIELRQDITLSNGKTMVMGALITVNDGIFDEYSIKYTYENTKDYYTYGLLYESDGYVLDAHNPINLNEIVGMNQYAISVGPLIIEDKDIVYKDNYNGTISDNDLFLVGFRTMLCGRFVQEKPNSLTYFPVDIDDKLTIPEIFSGLEIRDGNGNLIDAHFQRNFYNPDKIGEYAIVITGSDKSGNFVFRKCMITVGDFKAPKPTSTVLNTTSSNVFTAQQIIDLVKFTDYSNITKLEVDTSYKDGYMYTSNKHGKHICRIDVSDEVGNSDKVDIVINVVDDEPPVVTFKPGYCVKISDKAVSLDEIKANLLALDNDEGHIISIKDLSGYSETPNEEGIYAFEVVACDNNPANEVTSKVFLSVYNDKMPSTNLDNLGLVVPLNTKLTHADLLEAFRARYGNVVDVETNYLDNDEYSGDFIAKLVYDDGSTREITFSVKENLNTVASDVAETKTNLGFIIASSIVGVLALIGVSVIIVGKKKRA